MPEIDLFDFKSSARDFAVMGNPVAHSLSPDIHAQFGKQLGIDLHYSRIQVDPGGFDQAVSHFQAHSGSGLNITVPFKLDAWKLCCRPGNRLSERAAVAESVNTLKFTDDLHVEGDNTDGVGIVRDIEENLQFSIRSGRVLVVGAGGAVCGVLDPILQCRPSAVHIVNRTAAKATTLADRFQAPGNIQLTGGSLVTTRGSYDLVINGTAASLDGGLPGIDPGCIGSDTLVYDMMYGTKPTRFMRWALENGAAQASDGLGMLVEQAAESFCVWHDVRPNTAPVINQLRRMSQP